MLGNYCPPSGAHLQNSQCPVISPPRKVPGQRAVGALSLPWVAQHLHHQQWGHPVLSLALLGLAVQSRQLILCPGMGKGEVETHPEVGWAWLGAQAHLPHSQLSFPLPSQGKGKGL